MSSAAWSLSSINRASSRPADADRWCCACSTGPAAAPASRHGSHTRKRLSEIRHDLLRIRRTLAPTRDAVRSVADGRVDIDGGILRREVFPEEIERAFSGVLDKLMRATESLEYSRDLLAAVRDYQATELANEQNRITQRLGVIASLLLVPTFIVGVYGQNFKNLPETSWHFGYGFSWALIIFVTLAQLAFFRWKKWI